MGDLVQQEIKKAKDSGARRLVLNNRNLNQVPVKLVEQFPPELTELELNQNHLVGLPAKLSALSNLQVLRLQSNELFALPPEIGKLKLLRELDLQANKLPKLPASIGKLKRLNRLVLKQNKLKSLPDSIGQLTSLELLYLSGNRLKELPASIGSLPKLTILGLEENALASLPDSIGDLRSLTSLNVSKNQLEKLPASLGQLSAVVEIFARFNKISEVPLELSTLSTLNELDLGSNKISVIPEEFFQGPPDSGLIQLTNLYLHRNLLNRLPGSIKNLKETLNVLHVQENKLVELPPEIGFLRELTELKIDGNKLEALPAEFEEIEHNLIEFTFDNNPFSSQLENVDVDAADLLEYAVPSDEEDEDWEMEVLLQMLREGEIFNLYEGGECDQVKLYITPELDTVKWSYPKARLNRQISWAGALLGSTVNPAHVSKQKIQSELKYKKGGTVQRKPARISKGPNVLDEIFKTPANKLPSKESMRALAAQSSPVEDRKPTTIAVADIEEIALGKNPSLSKKLEETGSSIKDKDDDLFFCIVTSDRTVQFEASSVPERDEWARAFLLLIQYLMKDAAKDWEDDDGSSSSSSEGEETETETDNEIDLDSISEEATEEIDILAEEEKRLLALAEERKKKEQEEAEKKKKEEKEKEVDEKEQKRSKRSTLRPKKSKDESSPKKEKRKSLEHKRSRSITSDLLSTVDSSGSDSDSSNKKKKKKESSKGKSTLRRSSSKKSSSKKTSKEDKDKKKKKKKKRTIRRRHANRDDELAEIEREILSEGTDDPELQQMVEEIRAIEAQTALLQEQESLALQQQAQKGYDLDDEFAAVPAEDTKAKEEPKEKAAKEKEKKDKESKKKKKEQEEEEKRKKEKEEEEKRKKEEEEKLKKQKEEEEKKRKEEEERKRKEQEQAEKKRKEEEDIASKTKEDEEKKKKEDEQALQAVPSEEAKDKDAEEKEKEQQNTATDEQLKAIAEAERRRQELMEEKARERQAKLDRLRSVTQKKKQFIQKSQEDHEKEVQERKERLNRLKMASVKRLNEKRAVVSALKIYQQETALKAGAGAAAAAIAAPVAGGAAPPSTDKASLDKWRQEQLELLKKKLAQEEQEAAAKQKAEQQRQEAKAAADERRRQQLEELEKKKAEAREKQQRIEALKQKVEKEADTELASPKKVSLALPAADKPSGVTLAVPGQGSTIIPARLSAPQKSRSRIQGKRLPTRQRPQRRTLTKEEEEKRARMLRQKSIPRVTRKLDHGTFLTAMGMEPQSLRPEMAAPAAAAAAAPAATTSILAVAASAAAVRPSSPTTSPQPVTRRPSFTKKLDQSEEGGMTEAEKMRQQILAKRATLTKREAAAGPPGAAGSSTVTEAEAARRKIAGTTEPQNGQSTESMDMEALIRKRREEAQQRQKEEEAQQRQDIIKKFHENTKNKQETFVDKLVQLKGKRKVKSVLVEMTATALNEGDVFMLYVRDTMYVWYGKDANRMEKAKAAELLKRINFHECAGRAKTFTVRRRGQPEETDPEEAKATTEATKEFWNYLKGSEDDVVSAEAGGNDIAFERMFPSTMTLEKISRTGPGQYKVDAIDVEQGLSYKLLDPEACFVLDCGPSCIYLWIGRKTDQDFRQYADTYVNELKKQESRFPWMYLEKETENAESILFKEKFNDWGDFAPGVGTPSVGTFRKAQQASASGGASSGGAAAANALSPRTGKNSVAFRKNRVRVISMMEKRQQEQQQIDLQGLHSGVRPVDERIWVNDDGKGQVEMWILNNYELEEWPEARHGVFFSAESFILLYTYRWGGITGRSEAMRWLIYYWQGRNATHQEKGAAALKTKEIVKLVKDRGGDPDQVRVVQGKEPPHFLRIFENRMVVHDGLREDFEKALQDKKAGNNAGSHLYHVRASDYDQISASARAVEIPTKISTKRLNSQDAFILMYREKGLVTKQLAWFGEGSNEVLREATRKLAKVLVKSYASVPSSNVVETLPSVEMEEGKESSHKEWKKALGDKAYPNAAFLKKQGLKRRLFACSSTSGAFSVEEVFDFAQEDLEPSSIFFLDIWGEVYVWIGSKSYEEDERMGMATAVDFVAAATDGRLRNTPVYAFREGEEPIEFTCNFQAWDDGTGKLKVKRSKKKKKSSSGSSSSVKSVVKKSSSKKSKDSKDKSSYTPSPKGSNVRAILAEYNRVWTYAELTEAVKQAQTPAGQAKLKGLDKTKLEQYLSDEEFQKHVGMSKQDFYALPLWKQTNKRQEIGLY